MWQCPKCGRDFKNTNQNHYCGKTGTIDEYIAGQPAEVQPILRQVRAVIRNAAPNATEKISWQMPTFWQDGNLIQFFAHKKHLGLYPGELERLPFADRISSYKTSKGAIQLPYDKPIDFELIADITRWLVSCVEKEAKTK
ncbi:MAG: DUF1801 domain-containing protein [Treponema sp.]|nr:DUF1801 domain-containing protein [Treponema sp.]